MTEQNPPKFPAALRDMVENGQLSARPQQSLPPGISRPTPGAFRPENIGAEPNEPAQDTGKKKPGRPRGSNRPNTQSSQFGSGWRLGDNITAKTDAEKEEVAAMSNRTLLFQRSEKRGATQWNTVSVYEDGIDVGKRTLMNDPKDGSAIGWVEHVKIDPTIWARPVYPVATVLIHTKNAPADPETDSTSERKIRWRGRDYNAATWSEAVIGISFDSQEIKAQKADSWFPVKESNWQAGLLPWFRVMILNDPATLRRNPTDPADTKPEDLPGLPIEHMWNATGWCSSNKYAFKDGVSKPVWEHITPSHKLYSGSQKPYVVVAGDEKLYFDTMRDMITRRPLMGVWCGIGSGAFAHGLHDDSGREFRGDTSTLINLFGEPGSGKSTTAQGVVAMIGQPVKDGLILSHTTDAGLELMADLTNHGVFVIDEMQKHLGKKGGNESLQHMMGLLNGTGKVASANSGTEIRDRRSFDNTIIGTANNRIQVIVGRNLIAGDGHFADALEQRVIEVDAKEWSPFPSYDKADARYNETLNDIKDFTSTLTATHGHMYAPLIAYYQENRNAIVARLRELQEAYGLRLTTKAITRQCHFFAYTQVGIEALCHVLGLPQEARDAIEASWNAMIDSMSRDATVRQDNKQDDIIDRIVSWAEGHSSNFGVRTSNAKKFKDAYAWPVGKSHATGAEQIQAAQWRSTQAEQRGIFGYWVQDEALVEEGAWTGELWISATGRDAMEKDRLTSLPLTDLLQSALQRGWVDATFDTKGNFMRLDKKLSSGGYVYKLLVGKALREIEEGAAPLMVDVPEDGFDPSKIIDDAKLVSREEVDAVFNGTPFATSEA